MTTARHASISVELADQRRPRDAVLADHGLTDYEWTVEEMAFAAIRHCRFAIQQFVFDHATEAAARLPRPTRYGQGEQLVCGI